MKEEYLTKNSDEKSERKFRKRPNGKRNYKTKHSDIKNPKKAPNIPEEIFTAFNGNQKNCNLFLKKMAEFSKGRHVIDLSPLDIYELKNGLNAKRTALISILGMKNAETLQIFYMYPFRIHILADFVYTKIYQGLEEMLKSLDFNCYISAEKIINAGNVIKNHRGEETYGGNTVRDYLSHMTKKEITITLSDDEKAACVSIINSVLEDFSNYKKIKSLPFSIFRYKNSVRTSEDGEILIPDVEAKYNLKRILNSKYNEAPFNKLSMNKATILESKLIDKIRNTAKEEGINEVKKLVANMPDSKIKNDIITVSNIDNVSLVTNYGHIHDIVDYMIENTKRVIELEKDINRTVTEKDIQSIIQIEYTAAQSKTTDIDEEMNWITELGNALRGKNLQYGIVKGIIELGFVPRVDDMVVTYYDNLSPFDFLAVIENSKNAENAKDFVEQNLMYCVN